MEINITFFVQLFHFLIAYLILERLLLKPVFDTINQKQKKYDALISSITLQQQLLKEKELYKNQAWNAVKISFAKLTPSIHHERQELQSKKPLITFTQQEKQAYQTTLQNMLIQRLSHVL